MKKAERCDNCRFFLEGNTKAVVFNIAGGMCRRYAPTGPAIIPSDGSWQSFPPMSAWQWCGDYRPKDEPVENISRAAA